MDKKSALVLKMLATAKNVPFSRVEICEKTGLSRTSVNNILSALEDKGIVTERISQKSQNANFGRKTMLLHYNEKSILICGMLIRRNDLCVIISTLGGKILKSSEYCFTSITGKELVNELISRFTALKKEFDREIIAIGISCLGPADINEMTILKPSDFYGIQDFPLGKIIAEKVSLPVYFMHDTSAAAIAEELFGNGRFENNYMYVHILDGIGAAFILDGKLYGGVRANSGELGHTCISFDGPKCSCGANGCLEMYANLKRIIEKISETERILGIQSLLFKNSSTKDFSWRQVLTACAKNDIPALYALDEFCGYVAAALANAVNLISVGTVIVGCEDGGDGIMQRLIEKRLCERLLKYQSARINVLQSAFGASAPLIGSCAIVSKLIFDGEIEI